MLLCAGDPRGLGGLSRNRTSSTPIVAADHADLTEVPTYRPLTFISCKNEVALWVGLFPLLQLHPPPPRGFFPALLLSLNRPRFRDLIIKIELALGLVKPTGSDTVFLFKDS